MYTVYGIHPEHTSPDSRLIGDKNWHISHRCERSKSFRRKSLKNY